MLEHEFQPSISPGLNANRLASRMRELCFRYSELAKLAGVKIAPYRDGELKRFRSLPNSHQLGILQALETSIRICTSALENSALGNGALGKGKSLRLVWWALRELNLRPGSDLFSHLSDEDLIEIHNRDGIQVFRSFNMFDCISYSLEELACHEWWELFARDESVTQKLLSVAKEMISQPLVATKFFDDPPHLIEERFSSLRLKALIKTKLASPLFCADGSIGGYLSALTVLQNVETGSEPFKRLHHIKSQKY